ncbi:hypothetical protein TNCT_519001 [Trichonephila clavata]|uniref:Uncharacterized protein n=1 Tax=Trichonephila clavata TaxID=2740835 RepID=A0A8X6FA55_TRICU|nr:hypothetical protein TNCT_519001 [Trichonephila clavata]
MNCIDIEILMFFHPPTFCRDCPPLWQVLEANDPTIHFWNYFLPLRDDKPPMSALDTRFGSGVYISTLSRKIHDMMSFDYNFQSHGEDNTFPESDAGPLKRWYRWVTLETEQTPRWNTFGCNRTAHL